MKVLITGAAGFVGAHLIRTIKASGKDEIFAWAKDEDEGWNIALDSDHIGIVDITKQQQVSDAFEHIRPDRVYHLAAQSSVGLSWKEPALTYEVNAVGTVHLLEAVRRWNPQARVLLVGSAEQYGKVRLEELPITETRQLQGVNPYSVSKVAQEMTAKLYVDSFQLQIILVRAFNHIGCGQSTQFVIPDWCSQVVRMEQGSLPPVLKVGNINVKRDFTDVRDIVSAYTQLIEAGKPGEAYNVGSGCSHSLKEVLETILACSSRRDIRYEVDETKLRPADVEELRADITKLRSVIGWIPLFSLEQSIGDIMHQFRQELR